MKPKQESGYQYFPNRKCRGCGGVLYAPRLSNVINGGESVGNLCARCIALLLCRAAIAIHGDIDGKESANSKHPKHEEGIAAHERAAVDNGAVSLDQIEQWNNKNYCGMGA